MASNSEGPNEAQRLIESHIATLDEHKGQLERALAHLDGSAGSEAQPRRGQGAGRNQRAQQGGGNRQAGNRGARQQAPRGARQQAPRGARREEVIADLESNPGSKAIEIAKRVGINPNHAQTILANLVKQGLATKDGPQFTTVAGS